MVSALLFAICIQGMSHLPHLPSFEHIRAVLTTPTCCSSPQYSMSILSSTTRPLEPPSEIQ